jgi:hypothetical protein
MTFRHYLRSLRQHAGRGRPAPRPAARRRRAPEVETLEDRTLLSIVGTYSGALSLGVGPNINVSKAPGSQAEEWIAVNPHDPANMIAAPNDFNGLSFGVDNLWVTTNGGASWVEVTAPAPPNTTNATGTTSAGDPDILFDSSGRAYFAHLVFDNRTGLILAATAVSGDGGLTWQSALADVNNPGTGFGDDKESMAIGPDKLNPGHERVYIGFDRNYLQYVASSPDGLHWSDPVLVSDPTGCTPFHFPFTRTNCGSDTQPVVAPNGDVSAIWEDFGTAAGHGRLMFTHSTDGGVHWDPPKLLYTSEINLFNDPSSGGFRYFIPAQPDRGISMSLRMAVDYSPGPYHGRMYICFTDAPFAHNDSNIYLMHSDDEGATWSTPVKVNDDVGTKSQFNGALDVDPMTGYVALGWYDARNAPGNDNVQFYGTMSTDGGNTFLPNVQFSNGFSNGPAAGEVTVGNPFFDFGEYEGMAFYGGSFFPLWADNTNSTGDNPNGAQAGANIYTAPITVQAANGETVTATGTKNDQWEVNLDPSGRFLQFWENNPTLTGTPTFTATRSQVHTISVNGGAGSNTLTVDFTNGNPIPSGGLVFNGGTDPAGVNHLVLQGGQYANETETLDAASGTINFDNGAAPLASVSFTNVQQIDDSMATNTVTVTDPAAADSPTLTDGGPLDGLPAALVTGGGATPQAFHFNQKGALTLLATGGNDTVTVNNPNPAFGLTAVTLDGNNLGNAGNVYNLQNLGVVATVNGGGGNDTFNLHDAAGSLAGITKALTLNGQGGTNTLNATNDGNFTLRDNALIFNRAVTLSNIQVANLTGGPSGSNFTVTDWSGSGSLTGVGGTNTVTAANDRDYTLTNTSLGRATLPALALTGIQVANLSGGNANNTFTISGWTGTGSLNGGGGTDTVVAAKDQNFTLSDTALGSTDGMSLALNGITRANLTAGPAGHSFNVSGWTGGGSLTGQGGGSDTVTATKNADFNLADGSLKSGDGMNLALNAVRTANLTAQTNAEPFDVSGWTGGGKLTGGGGGDSVTATKDQDFGLSDAALTAGDGLNVALAGITTASLTAGPGNHTFNVGSWGGSATLTGVPFTGSDTVAVTKDANFTLSDTSLTTDDGMTLTLSDINTADLTGGAGSNTFNVSNWHGAGKLDGGLGGTDTVIAAGDVNFTLSDTALKRASLPDLALAHIGVADLIGKGNDRFDVSGWTGTGSLANGGGSDTVTATKDQDFTLSDTALGSGDHMSLSLSGFHTANLTSGPGSHTFNIGAWTGAATLAGTGATLAATRNADLTLTDTSLTASDGMTLALSGIATANLAVGPASHTLDVTAWHGGGSLTGLAPGSATVIAGGNTAFTLSNTALARDNLPVLALTNIAAADLTGTTGSDLFNADGWTGKGALVGSGGNDTLTVTRDTSFTLTNTSLTTTDGMALTLNGISTIQLNGKGADVFDVSGWTHAATLTGNGSDTVAATKNANFTLADGSLTASDGLALTLNNISAVSLTATGNNFFDVSAWHGTGTLAGVTGGSDTVTATKDADFTLSDTALTSSDKMSLTLSGIHTANLAIPKGSTAGHLFALGVWTGVGSLTNNGSGSATVTATKDGNFTLTDASLSSSDGMKMNLSGITTADLTGGSLGNDTFDVTGWTGGGTLDGGPGGPGTVVAANDVDYTLSDGSLQRGTVLPVLTLAHIAVANLTAASANHAFDVTGWTGKGSLTDTGGGGTVTVSRDTGFTLSDTALTSTDGMSLALSGMHTADLADGATPNTFAISAWSGTGSLTGNSGNDTVTVTKNADFTLSNGQIHTSDNMTMTLNGIAFASLTATPGNHSFDVTGWTGKGSLADTTAAGTAGSGTVTDSKDADFTLSDTALTATSPTVNMSLTLFGIHTANLTSGPGSHAFTIGTWSGSAALTGTAGNDTVTVSKDRDFTLTDTALTTSDGMTLALSGVTTANLTTGPDSHTLDVTGWHHGGSLTGPASGPGIATVIAGGYTTFNLSNGSLARGGDPTLTLALSHVAAANLTGTAGNDSFTLDGWTGQGTLTGNSGSDTVAVNRDTSFTLTNTSLTTTDGMAVTLGGITTANLAGPGADTFTVSGWTHGGSLTGGGSDVVTAVKNASFTLANGSLAATDGLSLTLTGIGSANLTGTGTDSFEVSGWTGGGTLTDTPGGGTVSATKNANFTLADNLLSSTDNMSLALTGITTANLTGGGTSTFTVSNWSGGGKLDGGPGGGGTVVASGNVNFTLSNSSLQRSGLPTLALADINTADLTGTGTDSFEVSGWTGGGTLTDTPGGGTVSATKDQDFTLSNTGLSSTDGMKLTLSGIATANLTGGAHDHNFTVNGWTGTGTLNGAGGDDSVTASNTAGFTLGDAALSSSDGLSLTLTAIDTGNLTAGPGATFDVSAWTGDGSVTGVGTGNTVAAVKNANFTLGNGALDTGDGMTLTLSGVGSATLTDKGGKHTFDVGAWTGSGSLKDTGAGSDTVVASHDASFTLSNTALGGSDGLNLTLSGFGTANLTGGPGDSSFTVSGWTGTGSLAGAGDTVVAAKDADFTLTNAALNTSDGMKLTLNGPTVATLGSMTHPHAFTVSGWMGTGSLTGLGSDTVTASKDADFSLSGTALGSGDGMSLGLSGFGTANLTSGPGNHTFTIGNWKGQGSLTGAGGSYAVSATKDANFTLSNATLATDDGMSLALKNIGTANLTGGPSPNTFDVSGWTGNGSVTGVGTNDTVAASKNADFTLGDTALTTGDGMHLNLNAVSAAALTDTGGPHTFDVGGWSGSGSLTGSAGGSDSVTATRDTNFTLSNGALSASDNLNLALSNIGTANLTNGPGPDSFNVTGWTGAGTLTGGGHGTVLASGGGTITLTNSSLARVGSQKLTLHGITAADLTGGAGTTFNVSAWTGSGLLNGGGGARVVITRDTSFSLSDTAVSDAAGLSMGLIQVPFASLTGGPDAATFAVRNWSGVAAVNGGNGANTYAVTFKGSGFGSVAIADGGSGASSLTVTGTPFGDAITASAGQVTRGGETVTYGGVANVTVQGGGGTNAITVNATPDTALNLFVDGGPSGANTLTVLDASGTGVVHGSLASGQAQVTYQQGLTSTVTFADVQRLVVGDPSHNYVQALIQAVLGHVGSAAEVASGLGLLAGGRAALANSLEQSSAGIHNLVNSWFLQYAGRPAGGAELAHFGDLLLRKKEEQVLDLVLQAIFVPQVGGKTGLLRAAGQALFGRPLTGKELKAFKRKLLAAGRTAALLAMLKSKPYRLHLAEGYVRQLFQVPAGQALRPDLGQLVQALAGSGLDQHGIRLAVETSDAFFNQG